MGGTLSSARLIALACWRGRAAAALHARPRGFIPTSNGMEHASNFAFVCGGCWGGTTCRSGSTVSLRGRRKSNPTAVRTLATRSSTRCRSADAYDAKAVRAA